jgi:hypothetical protein
MYIVWTLDKIFCRHQLGPLDLWCDLVLELVFVWMTYWQWGVLKSPTTTVLVSICAFKSFSVCAFKSFSVCLMKLGALTLDECRLIIVISFWCIYPFISMKCPLSRLIDVNLKSTLSKYCYSCLFSGGIGLVNLLPAFHTKPVFISVNEMGIM